jgi:polygalacturonase
MHRRRAALAALLCSTSGAAAGGVFDVTSFGAVRAAAAALEAAGGGTLLFPPGHTFLTGALNLTSNEEVLIQGTLRALNTSAGFVVAPQLPWFGSGPAYQAFLHSDGASNITLRGGGVVDGNGAAWWACAKKGHEGDAPCLGIERPRLLNTIAGEGLRIYDLTFVDSPMWNLRPSHFRGVHIRNVSVLAPADAPNTDGIDPDGVEDMLVEDCYISVGDDAIAVKSGLDWAGRTFGRPTRNVTFRNMRIGTGHGVAVGSEMSANVTDVLFENFVCEGTAIGPRIKSQRGRGGVVANVVFRNLTLVGVPAPIVVTEYYEQSLPPQNASATPRFANISVEGLTARGGVKTGFYFNGLPESVIVGVRLRDVVIEGAATPVGNCSYTVGRCEGTVAPLCPPCLTPGGHGVTHTIERAASGKT